MSEGERERGTEGIRYDQRGEETNFLGIYMTAWSVMAEKACLANEREIMQRMVRNEMENEI